MKKIKGFTLIELLVVIAIVGLLATLAVVAYGDYQKASRDSKRYYDVGQVRKALEQFFVQKGRYPMYQGNGQPNPDNFECDTRCNPGDVYYDQSWANPSPDGEILSSPLRDFIDSDIKFKDPVNDSTHFYRFVGNPDACKNDIAKTYSAYLIVRQFEKNQTDLGNYDAAKCEGSFKATLDDILTGRGGFIPGFIYQFVWNK